jgi:hypothetical protein
MNAFRTFDTTPLADVDAQLATVGTAMAFLCKQIEASRHALAEVSDQGAPPQPMPPLTPAQMLGIAGAMVRAREHRARQFRASFFGDPAWDMLLDLYVARLSGKPVYVGALSLATRSSSSTGLRLIRDMERHGEVVRRADPSDGRRVMIEISDAAMAAVERALVGYLDLASAWHDPVR